MQRTLGEARLLRRTRWIELHACRDARQHACTDAAKRLHPFYSLHMRNAPAPRTTWKAFVLESRRAARLSQQALAEALGVNKTTVWRWENEDRRPETPELAIKVATVTRQQPDRALVAAGFAIQIEDDLDPRLVGLDPGDPVVQHILSAPVTERMRELMLDRRRQQIAHRDAQDIAELEFWVERQGGQQDSGEDKPRKRGRAA